MLIINLFVGLGVFLFGMHQLESSIESISSRWVKLKLAKSTGNSVSSVFVGTVITALVQSSSMVSLLILAFASAGIIPLFNAIGVLLGANLGTTFTGWLVATLGFKLDLAAIAIPAIGLGGLIQVFANRQQKLRAVGALVFALGLLLFGLELMKEAVGSLPEQFDIQQLPDMPALGYLVFGAVLTAIIQSSSASMMMALAALHGGIIDLPGAAALIIGADLGTTSTTVLGSLKGSAIKRQLALAHLVFNLVVDLLAFVLLLPLLPSLLQWFQLSDPLYSLVAFHSIFNLFGLLLFLPFLRPYSRWIGSRFVADKNHAVLSDVPTTVTEAALAACRHHTSKLLVSALAINLRNLRLDSPPLQLTDAAYALLEDSGEDGQRFERRYELLKQHEGELIRYASKLQKQPLSYQETKDLNALLNCTRDAVYAVKTLKDIRSNLMEIRHAVTPALQQVSVQYQTALRPFYQQLLELIAKKHEVEYLNEAIAGLYQQNESLHQQLHFEIRQNQDLDGIEPEQLSTLFNINREVWHSGRNLLQSIEYWFEFDSSAGL